MSSVFISTPDSQIQDSLGAPVNVPSYIQFVPGYVVEVVHSTDSSNEKGERSINTIIALPHIQAPDVVYLNKNTAEEQQRYFPLFRTGHDVPSKGDPVLLCTIGKTNYYLGPLNTINNSPTWNDDLNYSPQKLYESAESGLISNLTPRGLSGESPNFNKNNLYKRLIKVRKEELDGIGENFIENETTGDYVLEGRHGNSLRIGSRSDNPYMFMSNARNVESDVESLADGSLISITSDGTLQQHFGGFVDEISEQNFSKFILASDISPNNNRNMSDLITTIPENGERNADDIIYNYSDNQIFFNSDKIVINSIGDSTIDGGIYLSSRSDTHIGAGRHLTISTNEDLIINSERTFLGNPTPNNSSREMEPMVLGIELLELLKETLGVIKGAQGMCQGAPLPLVGSGPADPISAKITKIENRIDRILSTKHFIEPNT